MEKIGEAINRIRNLECPTGELKNRVADILEEYNVANKNEVIINRYEQLDTVDAEAYRTNITNNPGQSIIVLAKSGLDDYVAKVVNAYLR